MENKNIKNIQSSFNKIIKTFTKKSNKIAKLSKFSTRVGVLTGDTVQYGIVHELGKKDNTIPKRSFLVDTIKEKTSDVNKKIFNLAKQINKESPNKIMEQLGIYAVELVKSAFETNGFGKWAPLKDGPYKAKKLGQGKNKTLINTSELVGSIASDVIKK